MESSASAASDGGGNTVTTQLASLVPSFDPSKDDMRQYQQRVELVTAAWPKSKLTELTTRLILNCSGSAFAKLQATPSQGASGERGEEHPQTHRIARWVMGEGGTGESV